MAALPAQFAALPQPLYVFDGLCVLCSTTVHFLIRHDRAGAIHFTTAQGAIGQRLYGALGLARDNFETFLFIDGGQVYAHSAAIFRFLRYLPWRWRALGALQLLPRGANDRFYGWIARHRYRFFGRRQACLMPDQAIAWRFID